MAKKAKSKKTTKKTTKKSAREVTSLREGELALIEPDTATAMSSSRSECRSVAPKDSGNFEVHGSRPSYL